MNQKGKNGVFDNYKLRIIEMLGKIKNSEILTKIYTVIKNHLLIIREKKLED